MERRNFLRTGLAASAVGVGVRAASPASARAATARRGLRDDPIKLSSNENPLGLSPAAREAVISAIPDANRYPGDAKARVVAELADRLGVDAENIVMGAGSTEILQMAVQAFGKGRARFVIAEPTYEDVPSYARPWDLTVETVPLRHTDLGHDLDRMRETVRRAPGPSLVYLCNPNNPTGTLTPSADIDAWIENAGDDVHFLIDEAYYEYAEPADRYWTALKHAASRPNVIVVRTFSKIYGMAGMRLGYAVATAETAAKINALAGKNNANNLACAAGLASLRDQGLIARSRRANEEARKVLHEALNRLELPYLESHTNFVMHRIPGELADYRRRMQEHGFLVGRPFPPMLDYNRVSLGLPEEMARFAETLTTFRSHGWV